jgi:transposase
MKLSLKCKINYTAVVSIARPLRAAAYCKICAFMALYSPIGRLTPVCNVRLYGIIIFTYMPLDSEAKRQVLQATGTFNPRADQVRHSLFQRSSFFDPEDLLQLKYETLRALESENCPIAKAARDFGLSRPTIYEAQSQFQERGLEGLLPHKRGPKSAHKLTEEVLQYIQEQRAVQPEPKAEELARRMRQRFGVTVHPRTIQKALKTKTKRGRLR